MALKARADQDNIAAAQGRVQLDSAALMTRYGSRLAAAQAAGSAPTMAAPAAAAPPLALPDLGTMFPALATPKVA